MTISGTLALQTVIGMKEKVREIKKRGKKKEKSHENLEELNFRMNMKV